MDVFPNLVTTCDQVLAKIETVDAYVMQDHKMIPM